MKDDEKRQRKETQDATTPLDTEFDFEGLPLAWKEVWEAK